MSGAQHAGIGRYVENLALQLLQLPNAHQYYWVLFFYDATQSETMMQILSQHADVQVTVRYIPIRHYSLQEQRQLPKIFHEYHLDLLHVPHFNIPLNYRGKIVITIHDLLWHEYRGAHVTTLPKWKYWLKYWAYRYTVGSAVKKAQAILVPAHTVRETVVKYYPSASEKIVITREGVSESLQQSRLKKDTVATKNLLYVGSLYPHKNIQIVLLSLIELPEYRLQIVGARNIFQDQTRKLVRDLGIDAQVDFLGYLPDKELASLMKKSFSLVQPSLFEGFGLTGVEAMSIGLPVIASDIPILQEIYQDAALFFDPRSTPAFTKNVRQLEQSKVRERMIQLGKVVAKQYNWKQTAEQTLHMYQQILR